ncbi:type III polyketide synthase [Actinomadura rupiterrae]|uniref:type III polyketide synthase n=1 Tax=Actinomadura rupiterrae TaxID=559627 RepID=UPI0020A54B9B|nr:3-oxoacyl-[acyl-carrier-protein] synthase III C-terminal domain-containing protein [Actinomadura rupiterrae]MCP2337297.1 putative naringenin-chalcone synthase [Actinomadura rupiterrae]
MYTARISGLATAAPQLVKMRDVAGHLAADPGGADLAHLVALSAIESKAMAINPLTEDPRSWGPAERYRRALAAGKDIGARAIRKALAAAGVAADEIAMLATVTTTIQSLPGLDGLAADLGMRPDTERLQLGPMGCYATAPALATCRNWVSVHGKPAVLLCVDMFSPHLQPPPYDKEQAIILTLFGDGAAALVIRPGEPGMPGIDIVDNQMITMPEHADKLRVYTGDHGAAMRLAPAMPEVVAAAVGRPLEILLRRNGLRHEDIHWWALHPGGRRVLEQVAAEVGIPDPSLEAAMEVMREYGNTVGPAVLMVLERLQQTHPLPPGGYGVALAYGPGATIWTVLLRG